MSHSLKRISVIRTHPSNEACPDSVFDVNMSSTEAVSDVLRDGHLDSCVEPNTVALNSFRLLLRFSEMLRRIRVFSIGFQKHTPIYGMTIYSVNGCYGENECELQICTAQEPNKQSNGIVYSFTCPKNNYRYALLDIQRGALHTTICEIYLYLSSQYKLNDGDALYK